MDSLGFSLIKWVPFSICYFCAAIDPSKFHTWLNVKMYFIKSVADVLHFYIFNFLANLKFDLKFYNF